MKTKMHNGSRLLSLLLAVVLVFTQTVPALAAEKPQDMNLRIAVMSDLHYLSPDMIADTEDFEHAFNSDRKLLKESSSVLHEMLERVRADKPDILLVSGDLTKDGEQECHAALAKQLQQLQQDIPGLKIYVINGTMTSVITMPRTSTPPTARPCLPRARSRRTSSRFMTLFTPTRPSSRPSLRPRATRPAVCPMLHDRSRG